MERQTRIEKFKKLIICAEKYIKLNALDVLQLLGKTKIKSIHDYIESKYKPMLKNVDKINPKALLLRFCIHLQNYQAMPKAIKYFSYQKNLNTSETYKNALYKFVLEYYKEYSKSKHKSYQQEVYKLYTEFKKNNFFSKSDEKKCKNISTGKSNISKYDKMILKFNDKRNFPWMKYSAGLIDAFDFINNNGVKTIKDIVCTANEISNSEGLELFDEKLKEKFYNKIYGINKILAYDYFKELICDNLIKTDGHIKELYQKCIDPKCEDEMITQKLINLFYLLKKEKKFNKYTLYYIDKILWLCCTGSFYIEGITLLNMNRLKFIEFYRKH